MSTYYELLSLVGGAVLIAVLSALLSWPICYLRLASLRWSAAVILPFLLSCCLYWLPAWFGAGWSEYTSWAFLFISSWFLAGVVSSAVVVLIAARCRVKKYTLIPFALGLGLIGLITGIAYVEGDWVPQSIIASLPNATKAEVQQWLGPPGDYSEAERWVYYHPYRLAMFRVDFTSDGRVKDWSYDR